MKKIKFSLNCQIFPLEAVYATCYNFIDKVYVYLDKKGDNILVSLKPKEGNRINPRIFEGEFRNELLHNTLRMKISQNNAKIREYIISQAICSSLALPTKKVQESEQESEQEKSYSYVEDPLGIAIPWEEKMKIQQEKSKKPVVKKARKKPHKKISKKKRKK